MNTIDLNGVWKLRPVFKDITANRFNEVLRIEDGEFKMFALNGKHSAYPSKKGWMDARLPCDVVEVLMQHGIIDDPVEGLDSNNCQWITDFSWWFVKDFHVSEEMLTEEKIYLYFEMIDVEAEFILNGIPIGGQYSAFAPYKVDVKRFILPNNNQLIIKLTPGFGSENMTDSIANYGTNVFIDYPMHIYKRRPQFAEGWDWCPCIPTCSISRQAKLYGVSGAVIDGVRVYTKSVDKQTAEMGYEISVENIRDYASADADIEFSFSYNGAVVYSTVHSKHILGGINYIEGSFTVDKPEVWWPNGYGKQPLYDVNVSVTSIGHTHEFKTFKVGIRTVEIDETPISSDERLFAVKVNGKRIFAKGGNWVPADSIYRRVTDEKYDTLVSEAAAANYNMLRMWGGGLYERDSFYESCSRHGILLMHDFMYACNMYPDHRIDFMYEARREAEFQIKRLRNYACLGFFTGNNENQEAITDWYDEERMPVYFPGATVFNRIQPGMVHLHAQNIAYRPSSPFGGDTANSQKMGDSHTWRVMGFKYAYELAALDRMTTKFMSEFGFFGTLRKSSMERFHKGAKLDRTSDIWIHHGERPSKTAGIERSIKTHLADPENFGVDDYLLYGGVVQGILYRELSEALRRRETCHGNLIWMYNDCWPETGWTIIDYYTTRKISFYFQKRAFSHIHNIPRVFGNKCTITALNDTGDDMSQIVTYGVMSFTGDKLWEKELKFNSVAFNRGIITEFNADYNPLSEFIYCKTSGLNGSDYITTSVRGEYRQYNLPEPSAEIKDIEFIDGDTIVTIKSDNYIPVAYLDIDDRLKLDNNFFELIPGQTKRVTIIGETVRTMELKFLNIDNKNSKNEEET